MCHFFFVLVWCPHWTKQRLRNAKHVSLNTVEPKVSLQISFTFSCPAFNIPITHNRPMNVLCSRIVVLLLYDIFHLHVAVLLAISSFVWSKTFCRILSAILNSVLQLVSCSFELHPYYQLVQRFSLVADPFSSAHSHTFHSYSSGDTLSSWPLLQPFPSPFSPS
jgi:hypothetical protein